MAIVCVPIDGDAAYVQIPRIAWARIYHAADIAGLARCMGYTQISSWMNNGNGHVIQPLLLLAIVIQGELVAGLTAANRQPARGTVNPCRNDLATRVGYKRTVDTATRDAPCQGKRAIDLADS